MKKELTAQDLELICSTLTSGAYTMEIQTEGGVNQKNSGEFLADHNKPYSLVLVNYLNNYIENYQVDYIIDFSGKMELREFSAIEFCLTFNEDGSIRQLFEEQKRKRLWGLNLFFSERRKIKILFKKHLFFKKQIQHLPCDNYLMFFGDSKLNRKVEIQLFNHKKHIIDFQIAVEEKTARNIAKQKYYMSKLSFCNFDSIEFPNEYFTKNQKVLIHSHLPGESNLKKKRVLFGKFISEMLQKTGQKEKLQNSIFLEQTIEKIRQIDSALKRNKLNSLVNKLDLNQEIVFALSFGRIDSIFKNKLLCTDFSLTNSNVPILFDLFYQMIDELIETKFYSKQELHSLIHEKIKVYGIEEFISKEQIDENLYFILFAIDYCASNPNSSIFNILERFTFETNDYLCAS
jgi:hypothetical protein